MPKKRPFHVVKTLLAVSIMLLSISTSVYAKSKDFRSPNFDMSLADNLNLISKTEEKNNGFIAMFLLHQKMMTLNYKCE